MYFFIQMAYELFAQNRKLNKRGGPNKSGRGGGKGGRGWKFFGKKQGGGGGGGDAYQKPKSIYKSIRNSKTSTEYATFLEILDLLKLTHNNMMLCEGNSTES